MIRNTIHFSGRVQGVGFRFTTCTIAQSHPVDGYVRNLSSGQVALVVEGSQTEIDSFLQELRQRMAGNIDAEKVDQSAATGEFSRFEIR